MTTTGQWTNAIAPAGGTLGAITYTQTQLEIVYETLTLSSILITVVYSVIGAAVGYGVKKFFDKIFKKDGEQ